MDAKANEERLNRLVSRLALLWDDTQERRLLGKTLKALDERYGLLEKTTRETGVEDILAQMVMRLANSFGKLSRLRGKSVLDIACGSNTSKAPGAVHISTLVRQIVLRNPPAGYTALFEPWMCRLLLELGANPTGVDMGDLQAEAFAHHQADLGKSGALDFLPDHSFDAIQDSRLFGSPEFTAQFPRSADRLAVAAEIVRQEQRLLKLGGIIIHSDARELVG